MRFPVTRLTAAALATGLALASGAALAQKEPAKPAAPAGQQPPPQPPSKVDLVSPEAQWVKLCGKEQSTGKEACQTMRDFGASADQPPMVSLQVFELQGEEKRKLRLMMLPIGMLLKPGFRVVIDKSEPIDGKYDMCFQNACTAEIDITPKELSSLKKGHNLAVLMRVPNAGDPSGRELTLNLPLKDFGPTFDGPATDPKVLEAQRQALQQQLQKKAEEQRKMLEQQQQQGGVAAPAAPAAAPAAPAAAAPAAPAAKK